MSSESWTWGGLRDTLDSFPASYLDLVVTGLGLADRAKEVHGELLSLNAAGDRRHMAAQLVTFVEACLKSRHAPSFGAEATLIGSLAGHLERLLWEKVQGRHAEYGDTAAALHHLRDVLCKIETSVLAELPHVEAAGLEGLLMYAVDADNVAVLRCLTDGQLETWCTGSGAFAPSALESSNVPTGHLRLSLSGLAVTHQSMGCLRFLLSKRLFHRPATVEPACIPPLHMIVSDAEAIRTLRVLLEYPDIDFDERDRQGVTPLHMACRVLLVPCGREYRGVLDVVRVLVEDGHASVDPIANDGWTPLQVAAKAIHCQQAESVARYLVHSGADVNRRSPHDETPLEAFARRGWWDLIKLVIEQKKADLEPAPVVFLLQFAVESRKFDIVTLILQRAPPLDLKVEGGFICTYIAAGNVEALRVLMTEWGIDPDTELSGIQAGSTIPLAVAQVSPEIERFFQLRRKIRADKATEMQAVVPPVREHDGQTCGQASLCQEGDAAEGSGRCYNASDEQAQRRTARNQKKRERRRKAKASRRREGGEAEGQELDQQEHDEEAASGGGGAVVTEDSHQVDECQSVGARSEKASGVDVSGAGDAPTISSCPSSAAGAGGGAIGAVDEEHPCEGNDDEEQEEWLLQGAAHEYICPVSLVLMTDPVCASDGHAYQREALQQCINYAVQNDKELRSPMTGLAMQPIFFDNVGLRSLVLSHVETRRQARAQRR